MTDPKLFIKRLPDEAPPEGDYLDHAEKERLERYSNNEKIHEFLWTRFYTKSILAEELGLEPKQVSFSYTEHGKPYLKDSSLYFNISHSYGLFAMVISHDSDCGVDCEKIRALSYFDGVEKRVLTEVEKSRLKSIKDPLKAFFIAWTVKESIAKCIKEPIFLMVSDLEILNYSESTVDCMHNSSKKLFRCRWQEEGEHIVSVVTEN